MPPGPGRRAFLTGAGAFLVGASLTAGALGGLGRWLGRRFSAAESRAAVRLPPPVQSLARPPTGAELDVAGLSPYLTPNDRFYRIDTALTAPQVPTADYRLRVTGLVDRQLELTYEELLDLPMIERDITLTCVSNEVGGNLIGNARWLGTRLDALLERAGVRAGADQVVGRSIDGFECGFPLAAALDGRDALIAVGMNGEPLPISHGFPARLVVPGLYGYVSATKWLTEIELTTFDAFDHYWLRRGWAREGPIKLMSRIDTPRGLARLAPGPVAVAGVAWAQHVGVGAVEVQVDDGPWRAARLAAAPSEDTWVQWVFAWSAEAGRHSLRVRAIDVTGAIQTAERAEPFPDGATGHHEIVVIVE
jgi:DMSO/TMAO reductase YedYZ molybdopterin-dependent catalytic subunit